MTTIALIAARGGSKGIPGKNLIDFCGRPLISWSIVQAKGAQGIDSVWVTSDSREILDAAKSEGAQEVLRPAEFSSDTATSESAWLHAVQEIEKKVGQVGRVVALQPTSPLRESSDIEIGLKEFDSQKCDSLFSAAVLEDFLFWEKNKSNELSSVNYDYRSRKRRQEHAEQFVENGSFYIFTPQVLKEFKNRLGGKIGMSMMSFWKTFEIDSYESLEMCSVLMKHYLLKA